MEQFYEIKVCYSDGWSMLSDSGSTDSSHEPEPGSTIDSNGEDSLIIRHFYRVLSRNTIPLEPWQIGMLISKEHYSSKEIGYELYKRGKISKEVLDGFPPESEEGKTRLEKRVNKLTQTIKDNFKRAIQIGDFDEDEYRVIFKYLENHNNWIR